VPDVGTHRQTVDFLVKIFRGQTHPTSNPAPSYPLTPAKIVSKFS
jgi:hypothetical protein